jgi:pyruvate-formate lyase-activating enzyme
MHTWDSHLDKPGVNKETFEPTLLPLEVVLAVLRPHRIKQIFFFGDDPTTDRYLAQLAQALKRQHNAKQTLLTNGLIRPPHQYFDDIQISIKAVTPALHRDFTGVNVAPALENFRLLHKQDANLRAESIFIPGYIDTTEIEKISQFIASVDPAIPYRLDAYIPVPETPWERPTPEQVETGAQAARSHLKHVTTLHGKSKNAHKMTRLI